VDIRWHRRISFRLAVVMLAAIGIAAGIIAVVAELLPGTGPLGMGALVVGLTVVAGGLLYAYIYSVLLPLNRLQGYLGELLDGNFAAKTEIRRQDELGQLARNLRQVAQLIENGDRVSRSLAMLIRGFREYRDEAELYRAIVDSVQECLGCQRVALFVRTFAGLGLELVASRGIRESELAGIQRIALDAELSQLRQLLLDRPLLGPDVRAELPEELKVLDPLLSLDASSIAPVYSRGSPSGLLYVAFSGSGRSLSELERTTLLNIAGNVELVLEAARIQAEFRRTSQEMERIISLAPLGIFTLDATGTCTSANTGLAELLDRPEPRSLIGRNLLTEEPMRNAGLDGVLREALGGSPVERQNVHYVSEKGRGVYLYLRGTPMRDDAGRVTGVLGIALDMTARVRLEDQLERSYERLAQAYSELQKINHMKSRFIDIASHELRTPVTVMRGYLDLLESTYGKKMDERLLSKLHSMRQNTERLSELVEEMLDVTRLEKGSLQIKREPISIEAVARDVYTQYKPLADDKDQKMTVEVEGSIPVIQADKRRVKEAIGNLVNNAIKYTQKGGRVQIGLRDEGRTVHLWVRDNGIGIPLEELNKIFERFYIITSQELSHQVDRLGLGLPITKGIVEAHGGEVWVESQVGKGSIFHIRLPKGEEAT